MKFLKYSVITLLVAVITDLSLVAASYPTPSATVTGFVDLPANKTPVYTRWLTKNKNGFQTYYNSYTSTWLNNPCQNCQVATKPHNEAGVTWDGFATKMGDTQQFTHNIATVLSSPYDETYNNYRLSMFRADSTLLTTSHSGIWTINP